MQLFIGKLLEVSVLSLSNQINLYVFQLVLFSQISLFPSLSFHSSCSSHTICLHFHIFSCHFSPVLTVLDWFSFVFLYFFCTVYFSKLQSGNWKAFICYTRELTVGKKDFCSVTSAYHSWALSLENTVKYCREKWFMLWNAEVTIVNGQ